jgi:NAD(P)-dependent dehydrogenase (short-subunit alcohol dehydrogenase family)
MDHLEGRVAVVTGAASGIGLALAERFATERMKVVIADVEREELARAEQKLTATGADVLAVVTDVSRSAEVEALAERAFKRFGNVHVLCNNAGVGLGGFSWEHELSDWEWVIGVNLWGVVHGIRSFIPRMLEGGDEGHVVNTASMAGVIAGPMSSVYAATKHAVVAISESLFHELLLRDTKIRASVLCPAWVSTRIIDSHRNRPGGRPERELTPVEQTVEQISRRAVEKGLSPDKVADCVVRAIVDERFWIVTHPEWKVVVEKRMKRFLEERNPKFDLLPER